MKKGIVLLTTLFFIIALMVLVEKNLNDTNKYIQQSSIDQTMIQLEQSNSDIDKTVKKLLKENSDAIEEILEITSEGIPLNLNGIEIFIRLSLSEYNIEACDVNNLDKCSVELKNSIQNFALFSQVIKDHGKIETLTQLNYVLEKYKVLSNDNEIEKYNDRFTYFSVKENASLLDFYITYKYNNITMQQQQLLDLKSLDKPLYKTIKFL